MTPIYICISPDKFYLTVVHYRLNEDFTHHRLNEDFTHPFKTDKNGDGFESRDTQLLFGHRSFAGGWAASAGWRSWLLLRLVLYI